MLNLTDVTGSNTALPVPYSSSVVKSYYGLHASYIRKLSSVQLSTASYFFCIFVLYSFVLSLFIVYILDFSLLATITIKSESEI